MAKKTVECDYCGLPFLAHRPEPQIKVYCCARCALGDRVRSLCVVPVPGQPCHPPEASGPDAVARTDLEDALLNVLGDDFPILIAGSLYLAGEVLRLNDELPD